MKREMITAILVLGVFLTIPFYSINSSATDYSDIEFFTINLVDDDGKDAPNVLQPEYTCDTFTTLSGTVFYLKAHRAISLSSVNLLIESENGQFNSYVEIEGLSSYLAESGVRVELSFEEQVFHADLKSSNDFLDYFVDSNGFTAVLKHKVFPWAFP